MLLLGLRLGHGTHFYSSFMGSELGNTSGQALSAAGIQGLGWVHDPHSHLSSAGRYAMTLAAHLLVHPTFVGHLLQV